MRQKIYHIILKKNQTIPFYLSKNSHTKNYELPVNVHIYCKVEYK